MNTSSAITKLSQAMLKVQRQLQPAMKDARNTFVGNDYATLNSVMDTCKDALLSQGIWLTQLPCPAPVELGTGHIALESKLIHAESGEWISSTAVIPLPKNDPQGMGSAITYARRYSLCAMLGIITEDDDGNAASMPTGKPIKPSKHKSQTQPQAPVSQSTSESLPRIDGVSYRTVQAEDGRTCVVATGTTLDKKEMLKAAGFKWNSQQKVWWK